jgi:hypothetical protein
MSLAFRSAAVAALIILASMAARADAVLQTSITIALPTVLPRLVVVEPGVQVVEDLDEEVFFVGGWYWVRRGDIWYRARDHRRAWVYVEPRHVPPGLQRIPPGHYRRFRKAEWKARKEEEKARRRAVREEEKERRHQEKEAAKNWKGHKHKPHDHDED